MEPRPGGRREVEGQFLAGPTGGRIGRLGEAEEAEQAWRQGERQACLRKCKLYWLVLLEPG